MHRATSGDTGSVWGWPEPARLNPGKAQKLHNGPQSTANHESNCVSWVLEFHRDLLHTAIHPRCHSPALGSPLVVNPSPKCSCSGPGQSQPPSTSEGLEWASCKSRSAAFSLPRDRKTAHLPHSRHCCFPWKGPTGGPSTALGKGMAPFSAVQWHFKSTPTHFTKPWPRSVPWITALRSWT